MTPTPSASTDADRRSIAAWNATAADPCDSAMLHARFEEIAAGMPDETAVIFGDATLTYAELNRRANQLAHFLRAQNVGAETRVGISMHRSFGMLVAIFGVLKAGAGYVPLDPAVPAERLSYMIADAQLALTLTQERFRETLAPHGVPLIALDTDWPRIATHAGTNPPAAPFADSLAYVTYTSGSTGRPKGILMTQRPLLNLLGWMLRTTHLPPSARTLQFASLSFDVSFQDIFSTLLSGGTLVLISEAQRQDLAGLAGLLDRHGVHRIFLPAVALQQLAVGFCAGKFACKELRKIISGSEQLVITDAIRRMFTALPGCRLHNEYGPKGFQAVGVCFNDMANMLTAEFIQRGGLTYPVGYSLPDPALQYIQHPMGEIPYVPMIMFIDRKGTVVGQFTAGKDKEFFEGANQETRSRALIEKMLGGASAGKPAATAPKKVAGAKKAS